MNDCQVGPAPVDMIQYSPLLIQKEDEQEARNEAGAKGLLFMMMILGIGKPSSDVMSESEMSALEA